MTDFSLLTELEILKYLSLYGLPKVTEMPNFKELKVLECFNLGVMKGIETIKSVL